MPPSPSDVLEALRPIVDPDFGKSIVDLGFVKRVRVDGGRVSFAIELTTPACPVKAEFERTARERVAALPGVEEVEVSMTAATRGRVVSPGPDAAVLPGVKNVLAVASGKGGVGKSTVALNLAIALRESGAAVGLMDCDVYGPSLPLLTGIYGPPKTRGQRILPHEGFGLKLMSLGFFLTEDSPVIWRGPMVHGLIRQFLTDVEWGELDYLVLDLPPGTGDAALTLTQQAPLSGAVIVTTANDLSLIDARKGLAMFEKVSVPVLGIDFLAEVPIDPRVVEGGDAGKPIVLLAPDSPVARTFRELAGMVARRLAVLAERMPKVADPSITFVAEPR